MSPEARVEPELAPPGAEPIGAEPIRAEPIQPDELTALVARLHETGDAMTTADVAATLGLPEGQVAASLDALRRERARAAMAKARRSGRFGTRRDRFGAALAAVLLAGTLAFAYRVSRFSFVPHRTLPAPASAVPIRSADMPSALRRRIEATTPNVVKVTVAGESYTGENASGVYGTDGLAALREAVELDGSRVFVQPPISEAAIREQLASAHPHAVAGLHFTRIAISGRAGPQLVYVPTIPGPSDGPAYLPPATSELIRSEAARRWNRVADLMTESMYAPTVQGAR